MSNIKENLSLEQLKNYAKQYQKNPSNRVIENAVSGVGINQAALNPEVVKRHTFVFSDETKQGTSTNQKKSGRCWYFAALNSLRQLVMDKLNVENFEFSQTHLYFYDKMEKANTYLENVIRTADKDLLDREVQIIMDLTSYDGGYWEFFVPLCKKYGLIPKSEGPETFQSEDTYMFTKQMDVRLKRAAMRIRKAKADGMSEDGLREIKDETLAAIYNIAVKCLGHPVTEFSYSYRDKDKNFHRLDKMTPVEFFEKYIGQEELDKRICIVADPREEKPTARWLKTDMARSVYEAEPAGGYNVPMDVLVEAVLASVKDGTPVWFACDVGKDVSRKLGILDNKLFDYDLILPELGEFSKAERFISGYSSATHAMNITGVDLDTEGQPLCWRVENSWGEDLGKKGTFSMSQEWFVEYVYEAIIDKKYLPEKWQAGLDSEPIYLLPWEPMA